MERFRLRGANTLNGTGFVREDLTSPDGHRFGHLAETSRRPAGTPVLLATPLLFLVLTASVQAYPLFSAPYLSFEAGTDPRFVAIADFNADGRPDLAVANTGSNTVSVLLGNGNGTFGARTDFDAGVQPSSVATADFNADLRPDLAVTNRLSNTVSVLLGNGNGTFGVKTDFATGSQPYSVAIADFNADLRPDLAVTNWVSNTVSVLLGNGNGTFGPKTDFATGSNPYSVTIANLNADSRPDLAVANAGSNSVSVLLGNPNGTFGPKTDFSTGSSPNSVAIGNFNADLHPDLAVANSSTVSVLLGNGNGTFQARSDFGAGSGPISVATADFHGDGWFDLAVANFASNTVSILSNRSPIVVDVPPPVAATIPAAFEWAVLPNPFSRSIQIGFSLARAGRVNVEIFNVLGQRVARVIDETLPASRHEVQWDGRDLRGRVVANGSYFLRLETEGHHETRKVVKLE